MRSRLEAEPHEYGEGVVIDTEGGIPQPGPVVGAVPVALMRFAPLGDGGVPLALVARVLFVDIREAHDAHLFDRLDAD